MIQRSLIPCPALADMAPGSDIIGHHHPGWRIVGLTLALAFTKSAPTDVIPEIQPFEVRLESVKRVT